jgi:hypothetical protein
MKKIFSFVAASLLMLASTNKLNAQALLTSSSKYTFSNSALQLSDSTQYYFSVNHYIPFTSRLQTDWDSLRADSIIQIESSASFYKYKYEKQFNAKHETTLRADFSRQSSGFPWLKGSKNTFVLDTAGRATLQYYYTGGGAGNNVWNTKEKWIKNYPDSLNQFGMPEKRPSFFHHANYDFANSNWQTTDSNYYVYDGYAIGGESYGIISGNLVHTYHLYGANIAGGFTTINWADKINQATTTYDTFGKTIFFHQQTNQDSAVEYEYYLNTFNEKSAIVAKYYPNSKNAYTCRNYVYSLQSPTHLIFSQGKETEFLQLNQQTAYDFPSHYTEKVGPNKTIEKWMNYALPFTIALPIEIITDYYNSAGSIYSQTIDSLYYDATNKIKTIKTYTSLATSNEAFSKTDFTYTADGQLQNEILTFFDAATQQYLHKWNSYLYTFYYGATPNAIADYASSKDALHIYPNPATNNLYVSIGEQNTPSIVTVYDMLGKQIKQFTTMPAQQSLLQVDIQELQNGNYLLEIKTKNQKQVGSFIKE